MKKTPRIPRQFKTAVYAGSNVMTQYKDRNKTDAQLRRLAVQEARLNDIVGRDGLKVDVFLDDLEIKEVTE